MSKPQAPPHFSTTCSAQRLTRSSLSVDMLVLAYVRNRKTHLGFEVFKRAGDYGFRLSVFSCNPLLSDLVKKSEIGDVEFVYKEIRRRRIEPNVITFNVVVNGLCKVGKLNKAGDVIEDMKSWGVSPNVVTVGKMYKADSILKEMVANKVCPNEVTYNILIHGFCKDENLSAAKKVFEEMQRQGLRANVITYNSLINGLCCDEKLDEAIGLRDEMLGSGVKPNVITYKWVLEGESRKAARLLNEIFKVGLSPSHVTYNTLMDGYCMEGNLKAALNGKLEEANRLLNEMLERGLIPNRTTYEVVREEMMEKGFVPDIEGHLYNVSIST
uniref:Pentacotripeptide-repeat region of PRORP domain-containing protein n=1 Tax=Fagus sylvatica TaxID=28930 RepID=A0A2N9F826_FAGSY